MRKLSFALVGIGLALIAFFAGADLIGLGKDGGIGASQLLGIQAGIVVTLVGIGLLITNRDKNASPEEQFQLTKIWDQPILYWVLFTFLIAYISFFLLPVFFSKLQIQYLTKYIPDAFVTHIGFDIEAIVSRIENWLQTGQSPYSDGFIAYPPLAIAVFATFSIIGYPAYFKLIVSVTVLAFLVTALIIPNFLIPKRSQILLILFFVTGLFSYGLQFEQERGQFNLIAFALCLIAIYIFHFRPRFRFFAYLLFSLSVQLKVYPVFFVVMLVDDWMDWRNIVKRFLGLGILNFSLLLVLGNKLFLDFIHSITDYQLLQSSRYENLSIKGFAYYLSNDIFGTAGANSPAFTRGAETFFWLLLGACFLAVVGYAIFHKMRGLNLYLLLICTIAALIIPSVSNDYKLSILIAPMALVFCCLPEFNTHRRKILSILMVVLASLAYWTTLYPATVKPEYLVRNFPALIVILLAITTLNFLAPHPYGGTVQKTNSIPEAQHE